MSEINPILEAYNIERTGDEIRRGLETAGYVIIPAGDIERLRAALQWYADATPEDFANDNGFKATAVLAR